MLSVIIPTKNSERALVPTLAVLVPGALTGTVRQVIIADGGSTDGTAEVADIAGCDVIASAAPLGTRLREAAAAARAPWLMFLRPGVVLETSWVEEATRTIEDAIERDTASSHAAVFRRAPAARGRRSFLSDFTALLSTALSAPHPDQGLMISRLGYEAIGGHRDAADPEADLLRRLGRRRIVTLASAATAGRMIVDKVK